MLLVVAVSVLLAVWQRYDAHRRLWQKYTAQSVPKSEWVHESSCYWFAFERNGFACLEKMDPRFVDFRYWSDGGGVATYWTTWRIPYTDAALNEHIKQFDMEKRVLSTQMINAWKANMPADWNFNTDHQLNVYQPKGQSGVGRFRKILIHDNENGLIYFCDIDQEIPA